MATRMQQRRGTTAQWTSADPILAAGEIGFETDSGQFKIGDGTNTWSSLSYFKDLADLGGTLDDYIPLTQKGAIDGVATLDGVGAIPISQLGNLIDGAPNTLDTLNELATGISNVGDYVEQYADQAIANEVIARDAAIANEATSRNDAIGAHATDSTNVHGIADTSLLATTSDVATAQSDAEDFATNAIGTAISTHNLDSLGVHGIADTAELATKTYADNAIDTHNLDTTSVHGIADTSALATTTDVNDAKSAAETTASGYVDTHNLDTTSVHGIADTSALATKDGIETLTNKTISAADNTVTVNLADVIDVTASAAELNILDGATLSVTELNYVDGVTSSIQTQLDSKAPTANPTFTGTVSTGDLSITGNLTVGGTTTTVNATDLSVTDPLIYIGEGNSANIVDLGLISSFNDGAYQHAGIVRDATDGVWKLFSSVEDEPTTTVNFSQAVYDTLKVGGIEYSDGVQVKQGVPSLTSINQKTAAYTTVLDDRDKLVEISSASGVTITIPANSTVAYPVGTSIDILQTGAGQVTIAGAGGVTVNATPGLKLRTQWSSATLFKRATDTWVVFGDLSA